MSLLGLSGRLLARNDVADSPQGVPLSTPPPLSRGRGNPDAGRRPDLLRRRHRCRRFGYKPGLLPGGPHTLSRNVRCTDQSPTVSPRGCRSRRATLAPLSSSSHNFKLSSSDLAVRVEHSARPLPQDAPSAPILTDSNSACVPEQPQRSPPRRPAGALPDRSSAVETGQGHAGVGWMVDGAEASVVTPGLCGLLMQRSRGRNLGPHYAMVERWNGGTVDGRTV